MQRPRIFLKTYGCAYNQSDSDAMRAILEANGYAVAESESGAGVVVLNTCTVKGVTEQKILDKAKKLRDAGKKLVLAGCLPEANPGIARRRAPGAVILGTRAISRIVEAVEAAEGGRRASITAKKEEKLELPRAHAGAIARIPIAEGCLGACSYCQTKLARGRLRSYPMRQILSEIARCVENGAKEIQLTAQDTGAYGMELKPKRDLADLLGAIAAIPGDFRVRVGMMNPGHAKRVLPKLLRAYESEKIYKFVHLPVQSGSDGVLSSMRRNYSAKDFFSVAAAFRKKFPEITLATDVIVGYPSETREDFGKTLRLLGKARFVVVNVSRFAPRPFTPAAKMRPLPAAEVKRRSGEASRLCKAVTKRALLMQVGKKASVLVTERREGGASGRTDSYLPAALPGSRVGERVEAVVTGATQSCLLCRPAKKASRSS